MAPHAADELVPPEPAWPPSHGLKDRNRAPVDRYRDLLTRLHAIEQGPCVIAQLARRNLPHATIVAYVRQMALSARSSHRCDKPSVTKAARLLPFCRRGLRETSAPDSHRWGPRCRRGPITRMVRFPSPRESRTSRSSNARTGAYGVRWRSESLGTRFGRAGRQLRGGASSAVGWRNTLF
jgi:hypothetical protein